MTCTFHWWQVGKLDKKASATYEQNFCWQKYFCKINLRVIMKVSEAFCHDTRRKTNFLYIFLPKKKVLLCWEGSNFSDIFFHFFLFQVLVFPSPKRRRKSSDSFCFAFNSLPQKKQKNLHSFDHYILDFFAEKNSTF